MPTLTSDRLKFIFSDAAIRPNTTMTKRRYNPDSKVHRAHMGPIWGRQDPGGPHLARWTLLSGKPDWRSHWAFKAEETFEHVCHFGMG